MSEKTAADFIEEMQADPTLDSFFDRDPRTLTRADKLAMLEGFRKDRSRFATAAEARSYKRKTGEDLPDGQEETGQ